jgi:hypothetical protein
LYLTSYNCCQPLTGGEVVGGPRRHGDGKRRESSATEELLGWDADHVEDGKELPHLQFRRAAKELAQIPIALPKALDHLPQGESSGLDRIAQGLVEALS